MKLKRISPSRIKTWDQCRFKYWLTYHTDRKLKSNWGAAHGSLIHDILENYANEEDTDWMRRLYEGYGGTLETLDYYQNPVTMESPLIWAKPKDYAEKQPHCSSCPYAQDGLCTINREKLDDLSGCPRDLFQFSIEMMRDTIDRYRDIWPALLRDKGGRIIGTEYEFSMPLPGVDVDVIGVMDLAIAYPERKTVEIIDYKTGVWTQDYGQCYDDIQVRTYSLASRRIFIDDILDLGFDFDNVILTFDYFQGKPVTLGFSEDEDLETEVKLVKKVREIQGAHEIYRCVRDPETYWKCKSLCDKEVCKDEWKGKFTVAD